MADRRNDKSLPAHATELWQLVVAYLKQETIEPIKGLGRFVGAGVAGSVCLAVGLPLLILAALRAAQTETGQHLTGNLSWIPYLIAAGVAVIFLVLGAVGFSRNRKRRS